MLDQVSAVSDAASPDGSLSIEEVRERGLAGRYRSWGITLPEGSPKLGARKTFEQVLPELFKDSGAETYARATVDEQSAIVDRVVRAYQEADAFPIVYYSDAAARKEIASCLKLGAKTNAKATHQVWYSPQTLYFVPGSASRKGVDLCNWMFPNLFDARAVTGRSLRTDFMDPEHLAKSVRSILREGKGPDRLTQSKLRSKGYYPRNFSPMTARAIYQTYLPNGGTVLDPSAGYGGRLLGALTAPGNFRYIGCDPNDETIYNLDRLGQLIESVTGRTDSYELRCRGSQDLELAPNSVELAFTSPPYFDLEIYDEKGAEPGSPSQSVTSFSNVDAWLTRYVRPTSERVREALKPGGLFLVNITDYRTGKKDPVTGRQEVMQIVDRWVEHTEGDGFELVNLHYLAPRARPGDLQNHRKRVKLTDAKPNVELEPILVFRKS